MRESSPPRPRRRSLAESSLAASVGVALSLLGAGGAAAANFMPREAYDWPGQLATLSDHRKLNFLCLGKGSPTVILESGFGVGALAWSKTQARIAAVTRVCAYDRAGYGFSDPGPLPRDGAAIARDLDRGLKAARIHGPYVLVGHSAGGLYIRLFAARRRRDVAGLVFVDSSVEGQPANVGIHRRVAHCLEVTLAEASLENSVDRTECVRAAGGDPVRALGLRPETWRTQLSEIDTLFTTTSEQVGRIGGLLKAKPVIVLTAGKADGQPAGPDDPAAAAWQGMHRELAARFTQSDQRFVQSSHLMMNDRPEVVAGAAIELVQAARRR